MSDTTLEVVTGLITIGRRPHGTHINIEQWTIDGTLKAKAFAEPHQVRELAALLDPARAAVPETVTAFLRAERELHQLWVSKDHYETCLKAKIEAWNAAAPDIDTLLAAAPPASGETGGT